MRNKEKANLATILPPNNGMKFNVGNAMFDPSSRELQRWEKKKDGPLPIKKGAKREDELDKIAHFSSQKF